MRVVIEADTRAAFAHAVALATRHVDNPRLPYAESIVPNPDGPLLRAVVRRSPRGFTVSVADAAKARPAKRGIKR